MERILVRISDPTASAEVRSHLSATYELVADTTDVDCDLMILDRENLQRDGDRIDARQRLSAPTILPVLLLANPDDLCADSDAGRYDDLLVCPIRAGELRARVQTLLRLRRISQEVAEHQQKLISIGKALNSASDAILIADVEGSSIFHNEAFLSHYGYTEAELNAGGRAELLFGSPSVALEVFETVAAGRTWTGEVLLKARSGDMIPTLLRADRIDDPNGRPFGMISVLTDISERRRAMASEREQRALSDALRDIATALNSTLDLDEVLKRILSNLGRVVKHEAASIMLVEKNNARIVRHQGYLEQGQDAASFAKLRLDVTVEPDLRHMMEHRAPYIVPDLRQSEWSSPLPASWLRSHIGVPIMTAGSVLGFLNLDSETPDFFPGNYIDWLQSFAEQAAIAIQNAQLHQHAEELGALKERQRLARDLHDAVSQTLFSATVIAESVVRLWETSPDKVPARLRQLHRLAKGALAEMRLLLLELRPDALIEAETAEVFEQLVEGVRGRTKLEFALEVALAHDLPTEVHVAFYYITQEAVNNVIKHAEAAHVEIRLVEAGQGVVLEVTDDGAGFEVGNIAPTSMGLQIMKERAAAIGAIFAIRAESGEGTTINVKWAKNDNA